MGTWFLSHEQERVVEFTKRCSIGQKFGNVFPDCLNGKTSRVEVENFTRKLLAGIPCYRPEGLKFLSKITWEEELRKFQKQKKSLA